MGKKHGLVASCLYPNWGLNPEHSGVWDGTPSFGQGKVTRVKGDLNLSKEVTQYHVPGSCFIRLTELINKWSELISTFLV